jgi:hypothetical protein
MVFEAAWFFFAAAFAFLISFSFFLFALAKPIPYGGASNLNWFQKLGITGGDQI